MRRRTLPLLASIFGTLLTLIVFTSACVFVKSGELQEKFTGAERNYHRAENALNSIRSDIYASMFTVQQYLLKPSDESRLRALGELSKIKQASASHFAQADGLFAPGEDLDRLRDELNNHWASLNDALRPARPPESSRLLEGTAALADALDATRGLDAMNSYNLRQEELELAQDRRIFGRFLLWLTSLTVALGIGLSIVTLVGFRRFEKQNEDQRRQTERAEFELRRLSQQLVKAQEEERKNISRELHDEVGQLLTGLRIELGNLQRSNGAGPAFESRVQEAKALAEHALRTIRNMAMLLRPSMLDDQGLAPALRWQAKEFSRRFEIPVTVEIEGEVEKVPPGHGVCLYRVVQEVLTNCAKHAQAKRIQIALRVTDASVFATIEDDGVGFKAKSREQVSGIGLLGAAERVRELRGTFFVDSEPARGTRVEVQLPINRMQMT
jgi:signal transduction histidine kinase